MRLGWLRVSTLAGIVTVAAALSFTPVEATGASSDVVPSSLSVGSGSANSGDTLPLRLMVSNLGRVPAHSVTVAISIAAAEAASKVANISLGTLAAGASGTIATTLQAPTVNGTYKVIATATTSSRESSTANNTTSTTLLVGVATFPAPTLPTLAPSTATAGDPEFTLTLDGSNFVSGATVLWNGGPRSTKFVSATRVTASIPATDIAAAGSASVTLRNPDQQVSNTQPFKINPAKGACATGQFLAEYFSDIALTAPATRTACQTAINYNWGTGGPEGLPVDNFSARWTGRFSFPAGSFTFTVRADDGVRLFLDGVQIISGWRDQAATTYTATRTLTAGEHEVKVEYYERGGAAVAQVGWAPASTAECTTGQFRAEYFSNIALTAPATRTACETAINYDWRTGGPTGLPVDTFSARWAGRFSFPAGSFNFTVRADDGVRLFLDGVQIIDSWRDQAATTYTATRTVTAGEHEVKVEYYERSGAAVAQVSWVSASTATTTSPSSSPTSSPTATPTSCTKYQPFFDNVYAANRAWADSQAASANGTTYYSFSYILDGTLGMFEGTGDLKYLERVLTWAETMISKATVIDSKGYRNWPGSWNSPFSTTGIAYELEDLQGSAKLARAARLVLTDATLSATYGRQAQAIKTFVNTHIIQKWYARNSLQQFTDPNNLCLNATKYTYSDKCALVARILLDLTATGEASYTTVVDTVMSGFKNRLVAYRSNSLVWDQGMNSEAPGHAPDIAHANRYPYMVVDAIEAGRIFTNTELTGIANLLTNVIWDQSTTSPQFTNYIDGNNDTYRNRGPYANGLIYAGWVTLGAYHAGVRNLSQAVLDAIIAGVRNPSLDYMSGIHGKTALAGRITRNLAVANACR